MRVKILITLPARFCCNHTLQVQCRRRQFSPQRHPYNCQDPATFQDSSKLTRSHDVLEIQTHIDLPKNNSVSLAPLSRCVHVHQTVTAPS